MPTTQYIGSRYVPLLADPVEWSSTKKYEPLTIVTHEGNSYTSRRFVPKGIDIGNEAYWALTGNYNEQIEMYRRDVAQVVSDIDVLNNQTIPALQDVLPYDGFSGTTVKDYVNNAGAKFITLDELESAENGIYTLGKVTVTRPIHLPTRNNRNIIIVDTQFVIDTHTLFPSIVTGYFILPTFVGCTFTNNYGARCVITTGSSNTVGSKFVGCNFVDVDCATEGYIQDFQFIGCYIQSHTCFLESTENTVQAYFNGCSVESESNKLIDCLAIKCMLTGTFEGNAAKDFYFINCATGTICLANTWLEGTKLINMTGVSSNVNSRNTIALFGCSVLGPSANYAVMKAPENPSSIQLHILASTFAPYDSTSRFVTTNPNDFLDVIGTFTIGGTALTYCYPIGGVSTLDRKLATEKYTNDAIASKIEYMDALITQGIIDSGGYKKTLKNGQYMMILARQAGGIMQYARIVIISCSSENNTNTNVINIHDSGASSLDTVTITLTKESSTSKEFTLAIIPSSPLSAKLALYRIGN